MTARRFEDRTLRRTRVFCGHWVSTNAKYMQRRSERLSEFKHSLKREFKENEGPPELLVSLCGAFQRCCSFCNPSARVMLCLAGLPRRK